MRLAFPLRPLRRTILALCLVSSAFTTRAAVILDQHNSGRNYDAQMSGRGFDSYGTNHEYAFAQSITFQVAGRLSSLRADLNGAYPYPLGGSVAVSSVLHGPAIETASVSFPMANIAPDWTEILFNEVHVARGQTLFFMFQGTNFQSGMGGAWATLGDQYKGGSLYANHFGPWQAIAGQDLLFQTYVEVEPGVTVAEPSSLALLALGLVYLGRRRQSAGLR